MACQLKGYSPKRIFDIGCGDGRGILALEKEYGGVDWQVFSIEENSECLHNARQLLRQNGIKASVIRRCDVIVQAPNTHAITTQSGRLTAAPGANLFEGDILADEEVEGFLCAQPKFDAITVWLMGTHPLRFECYNIHELNIQNTGDYRLRVQNKAYELANRILRTGGVLHIIDRGEIPTTENLRNDCLNSHRDQAAAMHTSLEVLDTLEFKEYTETASPTRLPMFATPSLSGRTADLSRLCMRSIIAVKG